MRITECRVLRKMDVRCSLFKLLLFQLLVAWCAAKHVMIDLTGDAATGDVDQDVQDSIRNLLHTGKFFDDTYNTLFWKKNIDASQFKYKSGDAICFWKLIQSVIVKDARLIILWPISLEMGPENCIGSQHLFVPIFIVNTYCRT